MVALDFYKSALAQNGADFLLQSQDGDTIPTFLDIHDINAAFLAPPSPEQDGYIRNMIRMLHAIQSDRETPGHQSRYNIIVKNLSNPAIARIQSVDTGMPSFADSFIAIRSAFLQKLEEDRSVMQGLKPIAATLREEGVAFGLHAV